MFTIKTLPILDLSSFEAGNEIHAAAVQSQAGLWFALYVSLSLPSLCLPSTLTPLYDTLSFYRRQFFQQYSMKYMYACGSGALGAKIVALIFSIAYIIHEVFQLGVEEGLYHSVTAHYIAAVIIIAALVFQYMSIAIATFRVQQEYVRVYMMFINLLCTHSSTLLTLACFIKACPGASILHASVGHFFRWI